MSIQAKNLKVIRKALGCTQSIMSGILKVGFRTYVRYEAGERDAPVQVLVKISKLGNISLERLLGSQIDKNDIFPVQKTYKDLSSDEVSVVNFKEGLVIFKNPSRQELITLEDSERKILTLFRKMSPQFQKKCIFSMGEIVESEKGLRSRGEKRKSQKIFQK